MLFVEDTLLELLVEDVDRNEASISVASSLNSSAARSPADVFASARFLALGDFLRATARLVSSKDAPLDDPGLLAAKAVFKDEALLFGCCLLASTALFSDDTLRFLVAEGLRIALPSEGVGLGALIV